jgi:hypothetical protein
MFEPRQAVDTPAQVAATALESLKPGHTLVEAPRRDMGAPSALSGIAAFLGELEGGPPPARAKSETPLERRARRHAESLAAGKAAAAAAAASWDPKADPNATGNAFSTLFVARLDHKTTERALEKGELKEAAKGAWGVGSVGARG